MKNRKRAKRALPLIAGATYPEAHSIYDRVMYRGRPVLSCESRRRLQEAIDENEHHEGTANLDAFIDFIKALNDRPDRRMLLSEIAMIWFLKEYGAMVRSLEG
ncbi:MULTISPECIES: hypothetical protein [unclassified Bradyrhizobium]|uniref:hypothetical protein n=1 Tax=unclassified Bradyrhizobium TaxID=2631580 RepID=UPI001CD5E5AA|nr:MULTISPECIES: hypothetical protein [unclassified Bradyrhizobium]MCA1377647.1 hypothetical protein [Bradyrhizobium sp. IC4060]MCA1483130.1 hypothetical protein [Bradyrhizobium sp. IC4061]